MKTPTFIPIEDAAKRLGLSCDNVEDLIRSGNFEAQSHEGRTVVAEDDVLDPEMRVLRSPFMLGLHRIVRRATIEPFDTTALLREIRDDNEYDD